MSEIKVLLIEDEPQSAEAVCIALHGKGFRVAIATTGLDGAEIAAQFSPDIIITDWEMPGLSGIETLKLLKKVPQFRHTPVIMTTGKMLEPDDLRTALEAGAFDYIRKPFDGTELEARISSAFRFSESVKLNIEAELEKQKILQNQIDSRNRELAFITLKLLKMSEFNESLLQGLEKAREFADPKGKDILTNLASNCRLHALESYDKEFEYTFMQVHPHFYEKLTELFPELSKSERKLAAFFKLNMSSKDIATITYQSEASLKKARHRLRKKIGLDSEIELCDFFQKL